MTDNSQKPEIIKRPAVFFDRDGVLNFDRGYTHKRQDLEWIFGAQSAIKCLNQLGYFVFVVTNQAGVARGHYKCSDVEAFHEYMNSQLALTGARIDAFSYCPYHPEGVVDQYRKQSEFRKPRPGMIIELISKWPVDVGRSFLVGDQVTDVMAAEAAGIRGFLFSGGDLNKFVENLLDIAV